MNSNTTEDEISELTEIIKSKREELESLTFQAEEMRRLSLVNKYKKDQVFSIQGVEYKLVGFQPSGVETLGYPRSFHIVMSAKLKSGEWGARGYTSFRFDALAKS